MTDPFEFTGVTIQFSGSFETPDGVTLAGMMDVGADQFSFTVTSFAATEPEARNQMNEFLGALVKAITPETLALNELRAEIKAALEGDSNDAEHDALASVASTLGIEYRDPDDVLEDED